MTPTHHPRVASIHACFCAAALLQIASPANAQGDATPPPPPPAVRVATVTVENVQERRQVTGSLRAVSRARVAAAESGRVVAVEVRESVAVVSGQVLARIDDRRLGLDLAQADADIQVARAELAIRTAEARTADDDLTSYRAAVENVKGSVSALTIRAAERDAAVAAARVQVAERDLIRLETRVERLRIQLDDTVVRAPFDGIVVTRDVEPGEWVNPGDSVCSMVSTGRIEAWLDIPEQYSYAVLADAPDLEVSVETLDARLVPVASHVIPDIDPSSRRYVLVAELDPGEHPLAPGMSVTAQVPSGRTSDHLALPSDAVLRDGGGYFVYKVVPAPQGGGHFVVPVSIVMSFGRGQSIYVTSADLADGDMVVVEGNERLRPMSPVRIIEPKGAGADAPDTRERAR